MEVKIGVSARHIHLTKEDFSLLFGEGSSITKRKDLSQPGEYACNETVNIISEQGKIENIRILGPFREYTQVEISKTDSYSLKINPPVKGSGDLSESETITIEKNGNKIVRKCCIISDRHIHINNSELEKYNLSDNQIVKLKINGIKGGILDNVTIKASDTYVLEAQIDLDDANSHLVNDGDIGEVIYE